MLIQIQTTNCFNASRGRKLAAFTEFYKNAPTYLTVRAGDVRDVPSSFLNWLGKALVSINHGNANYQGDCIVDPSQLTSQHMDAIETLLPLLKGNRKGKDTALAAMHRIGRSATGLAQFKQQLAVVSE